MKPHRPDYHLIVVVAIIAAFGLVMLSSASAVKSQEEYGQPYYFLKHQIILLLIIGIPAAYITSRINYRIWKKISFFLFLGTVFLLVLVFIPGIGIRAGGATRWISLGPVTIQPAEIAKLALILYLSSLLDASKKMVGSSGLLFFLVIVAVTAGLIIGQPNIGTAGLICILGTIIYFASGAPFKHLIIIGLIELGSLIAFVFYFPHTTNRWQVFLHPELDPQGIGYQINQALLAIGSGGFWGRGLGQSLQKFSYLPETIGDSIFAVIAEELGFIGATSLVILFLIFAVRGFKIAKNAPDNLGKLIATGITSWIALQAFINIAAISGLMPLAGVPLPFVSYGSSGLITALAAAGILINISKYTKA